MSHKHNFPTLGPIVIGTTDLPRAKKFYTAVFGITIDTASESPRYVSAHAVDGTHIELETDSEHRFPHWVTHNVGTYKSSEFFVADVQAFLETVQSNGGSVITPKTPRPWGGFGAEFADPDGNIFPVSQK